MTNEIDLQATAADGVPTANTDEVPEAQLGEVDGGVDLGDLVGGALSVFSG
jgi:hypothetical protein